MTLKEAIRSEIQRDKNFWKSLLQESKNEFVNSPINKTVGNIATGAVNTVKESFDIVVWFQKNWQLAIVGLVSLLILLKD